MVWVTVSFETTSWDWSLHMVPVVVLDDWRYGHRAGCCVAPWLGWSRNLSVFCATLSRMRLSPPRYETCWNDLSRQQLTLYRTYPSNHLINGHPLIFGLKFFISTLHTQIHPHQDDLSSSFSQNKYNTVLWLLQFHHIQWTSLKIFTNSLWTVTPGLYFSPVSPVFFSHWLPWLFFCNNSETLHQLSPVV